MRRGCKDIDQHKLRGIGQKKSREGEVLLIEWLLAIMAVQDGFGPQEKVHLLWRASISGVSARQRHRGPSPYHAHPATHAG